MKLWKMNGVGNAFAIFDARSTPFSPSVEQIRQIAADLKADQVIAMERDATKDVFMRIWNSDGGEVSACGNASRCVGKLILDVGGGFSPKKLPKKKYAPVTLKGSANVSTTDGTVPPIVNRVVVDFDRNGKLDTKGLPVCKPSRLENTVVKQARKACKKAIVGKGFASAQVTVPDQPPIPATSPLTIFNGPRRGGSPTSIIHAYTTIPAPTTFVVVARITRAKGRYRYRVTANVPPIAGGYGALTFARFKVGRVYKHKGKRRSYASARCRDGRLQAQGRFEFADGTVIGGTALRRCKARK